jgi:hypothetical protein
MASTLSFVEARCPRCGAELPADAVECPTCAYGDVEDIVLLEAKPPIAPRSEPTASSALPRVLAALAVLVVVVAVIFTAVR